MSKVKYKKIIKSSIQEYALKYLNDIKISKTKGSELTFKKLELAKYLTPSVQDISVEMCKFIIKVQMRMLEVKCNFPSKYEDLLCNMCKITECSQEHLLECKVLNGEMSIENVRYNDIYGENIENMVIVAKKLKRNLRMKIELENGM